MNLVLGPLIGAVSPASANVWGLCEAAGDVVVRLAGPDGDMHEVGTFADRASLLTFNACVRGLAPETTYRLDVLDADGAALAPPRPVRTLPAETDRFSFVFGSCHKAGEVPDANRMATWTWLAGRVADPAFARFMLHIGDQIYADEVYEQYVGSLSGETLAEARASGFEEVVARALPQYVAAYVRHWSPAPVREVHAMLPNFMLWDDHDIADGWGSRASSGWDSMKAVFSAAETAYRRFQHGHNPRSGQFPNAFASPAGFGYGFNVGSKVAFVLPDQRSFRSTYAPTGEHTILGTAQAQALCNWLNSPATAAVKLLFFIATVPLFHSSPSTIRTGAAVGNLDALDNWTAPDNAAELAFLLEQLAAWQGAVPGRRVVVLAGDVHMADAAVIEAAGQGLVQFVSSPLTNDPAPALLEQALVGQAGRVYHCGGIDAAFRLLGHYRGQNVGRVTVDVSGAVPQATFEVYTPNSDAPVLTAKLTDGAPWAV